MKEWMRPRPFRALGAVVFGRSGSKLSEEVSPFVLELVLSHRDECAGLRSAKLVTIKAISATPGFLPHRSQV